MGPRERRLYALLLHLDSSCCCISRPCPGPISCCRSQVCHCWCRVRDHDLLVRGLCCRRFAVGRQLVGRSWHLLELRCGRHCLWGFPLGHFCRYNHSCCAAHPQLAQERPCASHGQRLSSGLPQSAPMAHHHKDQTAGPTGYDTPNHLFAFFSCRY